MINELVIKNLKSFDKLTLTLKSLTVLAGINGAGKSTIIQSLRLLRQSHLQSRLRGDGLSLNGDLISLGTAKDALSESANDDFISIGLCIDNIGEVSWSFDAKSTDSNLLPLLNAPQDNTNVYATPLFNDGFHYLKAERLGPRVLLTKDDYNVKRFRTVGISGEFIGHFLQVFGDQDINQSLKHPNASSLSIIHNAEAWIGEICPNTRLTIQDYIETEHNSLRYASTASSDISNFYRATNIGFGVSYILPVIVVALSAKEGDILVIDTPEAHLHPRGQSKIGELLSRVANTGVQVIIETHSDHVLNGIRLSVHQEHINNTNTIFHYLSKNTQSSNSTVQTLNIDSNGRFDYWPEGFFDEWNTNLQKLLSPKN